MHPLITHKPATLNTLSVKCKICIQMTGLRTLYPTLKFKCNKSNIKTILYTQKLSCIIPTYNTISQWKNEIFFHLISRKRVCCFNLFYKDLDDSDEISKQGS